MDFQGQQQPERLEDQLRTMILSSPNQAGSDDSGYNSRPTVRLPFAGAYPNEQQQQQYHTSQPSQRQNWKNGYGGRPEQAYSPFPPVQNVHSAQPRQQLPPQDARFSGPGHHQQRNFGPRNNNANQHGFHHASPPSPGAFASPHQRARYQQQVPLDPNAFGRNNFGPPFVRANSGAQQLFNPNGPSGPPRGAPQHSLADQNLRQAQHLDNLAAVEVSNVEMSAEESNDKEAFRRALGVICSEVSAAEPERLPKVTLECFGSFKSGFATAGSDMDLVIVVQDQTSTSAVFSLMEDDLPRVLEQRLLQLGYGARLLTRTRVPIIKVCQKPDGVFLDKLREEREKWDALPHEKKYPHLYQDEEEERPAEETGQLAAAEAETAPSNPQVETNGMADAMQEAIAGAMQQVQREALSDGHRGAVPDLQVNMINDPTSSADASLAPKEGATTKEAVPKQRRDDDKPWTRERKAGPLDFPKSGVGIQSDINFFNPLGLHNTQMLRCYSLCDPRVRPMVLFVKAWVKRRKINSSYSGTLSSYGYVLMVLHYLINVAQPAVLPNLQGNWRPFGIGVESQRQLNGTGEEVDGWQVNFWRNEEEIIAAARNGQLTTNRQPPGELLAGFFHYYASQGGLSFRWMQEVLSLRSIGGLLSKEEKGWTKAHTEEGEGKKVQHRYLFCIEDPFELNHNVARTVTHKGIVAIRDEFRRARRILIAVGYGQVPRDGELFSQLVEAEDFKKATEILKKEPGRQETADGPESAEKASTAPQPRGNLPSREAPSTAQQNGTAKQQQQLRLTNQQRTTNGRPTARKNQMSNSEAHAAVAVPHMSVANKSKQHFNVNDKDSFPTLASTPPAKAASAASANSATLKTPRKKAGKKASPTQHQRTNSRDAVGVMDDTGMNFSEVSGDKAKAILAEVQRKKDEAQAESTAMGAAEAVLGGDSDW